MSENNNAIINVINNNIDIINEYEKIFVSGKFNDANIYFNEKIKTISDAVELVINCFALVDANDETGYQMKWLNIMKTMVGAVKSDDVFYKYDVICYDIRDGFSEFLNILGE